MYNNNFQSVNAPVCVLHAFLLSSSDGVSLVFTLLGMSEIERVKVKGGVDVHYSDSK